MAQSINKDPYRGTSKQEMLRFFREDIPNMALFLNRGLRTFSQADHTSSYDFFDNSYEVSSSFSEESASAPLSSR